MVTPGQGSTHNYWRIGKRLARFGYRCLARIFLSDKPIPMIDNNIQKSYSVIQPSIQNAVTSFHPVPDHILKPSYYTGEEEEPPSKIIVKTEEEIEAMRSVCALAKKMLNVAGDMAKVGVTTNEIDKYIHTLIIKHNAYPSPLMYLGFPKSICTSVNNVAVHGIPDLRPLENGDIITIDVSVYFNGFHGDCAATYCIGDVNLEGRDLVKHAQIALDCGISVCKPGQPFFDIAHAITLSMHGRYTIVPSICGHGIGRYFHEMPQVDHSTLANFSSDVMEPGMVFTIEPCVGDGDETLDIMDDGLTLVTADDSRTAQFEETVLITNKGVEILTR